MTLLRKLSDSGVTVLMVEQNVRTALTYANRALVLRTPAEVGRISGKIRLREAKTNHPAGYIFP